MRRLPLAAAALALLLAGGLLAARAEEAADREKEMAACRSLAADRDFGAAEKALEAFAAKWKRGEAVEEAALLLGRTRLLAGRPDEALATLRALVTAAPDGAWTEKARWVMADAFAAKRDWKSAADVLQARTGFLASPEHRRAVAGYYLEVADEAYDGKEAADDLGRRSVVKDFPRALDFYRRARAVELAPADAPRVRHRIARSALEAGDPASAVAEWTGLLETGGAGDLAAEATFGLGEALARTGDLPGARKRFREVAARWADSGFAPRALVALGDTFSPMSTRDRADLDRGLDAWREFRRLYSGHADGPAIAYRIGLALANFGDRALAVKEWAELLGKWPEHEFSPQAVHGTALAKLGLEDFDGAVASWKDLLARWPNHPLWSEARRMLPKVAFARAEVEMREKRWDGAVAAFRRFLEEFPGEGEDDAAAQSRIGDALKEKGDRDGALEAWRLVPKKWPEGPNAPAAWAKAADFLADRVGDLPAAIREYEGLASRYPASPQGQEARRVLGEMKGKFLEASLDRPITTDRRPRIAFRLRNVDRLRMKAYRVDLEEFVRAKLSLAGADQVVTDVVKPDAEWIWQPENHERFRMLERKCEVPVQGPGAWIVRAQDEELSATILVVSSDLSAVVKRSRGQTLVLVLDLRTGAPVAGARVIVPGGPDAVTGPDGVWIGGESDGRVLASKDGSHAFALGEAGPGASFGYTPKVYLFTDRPLYRPGQDAAVKGFARRVEDGAYACREGDRVEVVVEDPRGTTVLRANPLTDRFGGFEARVPVVEGAALGTWRVTARYQDRSFIATFEVREFRRPELEIAIAGEKPCWLAGEEVKASVTVRYGAGGVAKGAPVRWRVGRQGFSFDGSDLSSYASWFRDPAREAERAKRTASEGDLVEVASGEGAADGKGVLAVSFPTEAGDRDHRYVLEVMVRDGGGGWVRDAESFPVTRQGFYAVARSERKVWKPREEMTLEVFTVDANQSPVKASGRAVVARRRAMPGGRVAEEEVSSVAAETGADGRAVVKLRAELPGEYSLAFVARDARGNAVEGRAPVTVAGEAEDPSKDLRVVCDRETYREGDEAAILVNAPAAPCTILLTFEGERVLEHRVLRATERSTTVTAAMKPLFAPNVFVRAALLRDDRLLEGGDEVLVFRYLNVEVAPERAEARPGEKVAVAIRTTDQRGNPVSAGVAVSAVDRAILQLQPDRTPDPRPFFYDQRRALGVRTACSAAFLPSGTTRPTNKDLLFEEARRLGRAGYERLQRHVRDGKALLDQGNLDAARAELEKALELSPGNYEARVLLARAAESVRAREEAKFKNDEPGLGEMLSRDELRKSVERERAADRGGPPADKKAGTAGRPRPSARPPGAPAPSKALKDAEGGEGDAPAEESAESEANDSIGVGGGAGGAFGGRRGGRRNLKLAGGGGGVLPPLDVPASLRERFLDSALWAPSVTTGADGTARVEIDLPDNLTSWRIVARGASVDTLVGEGRGGLAVRLPVLIRTSAPRFLGGRDEATVETVVHNDSGAAVDARVSLAGTGVEVKGATETAAALAAGEVKGFPWNLAAGPTGLATLEAKVLSAAASDAQKTGLPILPHGAPWVRAASGSLRDSAVAALDLPEGAQAGTARLRVSFSPSLDAILLSAVEWNGAFPYGCVEQTVHRFLPALAAEDALKRASVPDAALRARLRDSVERGLLALYALQSDDGTFGWAARGGTPDPRMTAFAVGGMLRAERAGHVLSPGNRERGIQAARALAKGADPEAKAHLLHALAWGGAADLGDLNALFRNRDSLSDRGLARLSLAMALTGRKDRAAEGVAILRTRAVAAGDLLHWDDGGALAARRGIPVDAEGKGGFVFASDAEPTALALQAFLAVAPDDPVVDPAVRWILSRRRGPCWRSTMDTAAVVDALGAVLARRGVERQEFTARVFVNDGAAPAAVFTSRPADGGPSRDLEIPTESLKAGRNAVRVEKDGGGEVHFAAVLTAVLDGEDVPAEGNLLRVERRWVRWFPRREGPLPEDADPVPGWSCADPSVRPSDEALPSLSRVGSGDLFRATLVVEAREPLEYVLLEDPIPAGCDVVEGREEGAFDRFERRDDRAVFFLSKVPAGRTVISYVLQGVFPGAYHAMPAGAHAMYEPEVRGRSAEGRLAVAPEAGVVARRGDSEAMTPDEVLGAARRALRRERWEEARDAFRSLLKAWKLLPAVEVEAWAGIRTASLRLSDDRGIVESHEALLERDPRRVPADPRDALAVARAYHALGEHERAASLFRGLADAFFAEERAVAEGYLAIGAPMRSVSFRAEILMRYPDGSTTDAEELALCRALRETRRTAEARTAPGAPPVPAPAAAGPAGLLLPEAAERLRMLLAHRPLLGAADEADMLLVDTLRRMDLPGDALAEGERFLGRYPDSRWLDDVTWFLASAAFDKGDWDRALAMAAPLADGKFPRDDDPLQRDPSPLRPQAWHLRGKVAHLRGDLAGAVPWYALAKDAVPDAADAFAFLTATSLEVPELASFPPGAEPGLAIRRRNVAALEARVYPVDFMILYAVRKDLSAVNRIDLTGIVPAARIERTWKDAGDRLWHEETLRLPVKDKGVYLVNFKGDAAAACIVIVSELRLEVQQAGPRLRVYATLARTGEPAPEVYVKVADGGTIKAQGFTDARGVFEAGEVGGTFSVVAEKDGSYALYRR